MYIASVSPGFAQQIKPQASTNLCFYSVAVPTFE